MSEKVLGLTATVVFESSLVNRDEKIGGNITSIRKINRHDGIYSFMSRPFMRHHMFNTLLQVANWNFAPVAITKGGKKVIQFDFPRANIVNYPEMDIFGFMKTENNSSITRKAPLGMTKAISIEPWRGDMAFYANHDMVARACSQGLEATPDPFSKEEHYSLYKLTFTLDLYNVGIHKIFEKETSIDKWIKEIGVSSSIPAEKVKERVKRIPVCDDTVWYEIPSQDGSGECKGYVGKKKETETITEMTFLITDEEYKKRIKDIITVIRNGFNVHSSTECYGMIPRFCVLASLKAPAPVFHSSIHFNEGRLNSEPLINSKKNEYVIKAWYYADDSNLIKIDEIDEAFEGADLSKTTTEDIIKEIIPHIN